MGDNHLVWGNLVHLSYNMWEGHIAPEHPDRGYRPYLQFDENLWRDILQAMADAGMTMVVLDLGDGVVYHLDPARVLGFLQTTWKATLEEHRAEHMAAIKQVEKAMAETS